MEPLVLIIIIAFSYLISFLILIGALKSDLESLLSLLVIETSSTVFLVFFIYKYALADLKLDPVINFSIIISAPMLMMFNLYVSLVLTKRAEHERHSLLEEEY